MELQIKSKYGVLDFSVQKDTRMIDLKEFVYEKWKVPVQAQAFRYGVPPAKWSFSDRSCLVAVGVTSGIFYLDINESFISFGFERFTFPTDFPKDLSLLESVKVFENGSSKPELMRNPMTKIQYVVKSGAGDKHCINEYITNEAYRASGCQYVPRCKLQMHNDHVVLVSEYIEGKTWKEFQLETSKEACQKIRDQLKKHFVLDCLFGNWDVMGADDDNVVIDLNGIPWRIDNAGSLKFRAKGTLKSHDQWCGFVSEINSMVDEEMNPCGRVFSTIQFTEICDQIKDVLLKKKEILAVLDIDDQQIVTERLQYLSDIVRSQQQDKIIEEDKDFTLIYKKQLESLADMGFTDTDSNIVLLTTYRGNTERVLNHLLGL